MHGNVFEWCSDWYAENYYRSSPTDDPPGPDFGTFHVVRSGSWYSRTDFTRSCDRYWFAPDNRSHNCGFRIVRSAY
jgi:formylglycine-generating enzyme required for sulfatase activity